MKGYSVTFDDGDKRVVWVVPFDMNILEVLINIDEQFYKGLKKGLSEGENRT